MKIYAQGFTRKLVSIKPGDLVYDRWYGHGKVVKVKKTRLVVILDDAFPGETTYDTKHAKLFLVKMPNRNKLLKPGFYCTLNTGAMFLVRPDKKVEYYNTKREKWVLAHKDHAKLFVKIVGVFSMEDGVMVR
jgi:hypothetical protein